MLFVFILSVFVMSLKCFHYFRPSKASDNDKGKNKKWSLYNSTYFYFLALSEYISTYLEQLERNLAQIQYNVLQMRKRQIMKVRPRPSPKGKNNWMFICVFLL